MNTTSPGATTQGLRWVWGHLSLEEAHGLPHTCLGSAWTTSGALSSQRLLPGSTLPITLSHPALAFPEGGLRWEGK